MMKNNLVFSTDITLVCVNEADAKTSVAELNASASEYEPPAWHGRELARREKLYAKGKVPVYDWVEVKARLDDRFGPLRISAHFGPK